MYRTFYFALLLCSSIFLASQQVRADSVLTLEEVLQATLTQNPDLKAMQQDAEATKAKASQARSWDDPMIGVRLYQVPFNGTPGDAMDIDYIASQKIPFPGKKKAAEQIIFHDYLHHLENLNANGRTLLKEAKQTYYSLYAIQKQLDQNLHLEKILKNMLALLQSKMATNEASSLEAIQGQGDLTKLLIEREPLLEQKKILRAKLAQLMAGSHAEKIVLPAKLELPHWNISLDELTEYAQNYHSSLKLAEHAVGQKNWAIKAAKREYYPDFLAQAEYIQKPGSSENAWTGELLLNVPLLFNKKSKAVEQAKAELASAQYSKISAKNNVTYKVQETFSKMKSAEKILQLNQKTLLPQTKHALELNALSYSTGKSTFQNYLDAARAYLEAQSGFWKSYEAFAFSVFEMEEAAGLTKEEWSNLKSKPESLNEKK